MVTRRIDILWLLLYLASIIYLPVYQVKFI